MNLSLGTFATIALIGMAGLGIMMLHPVGPLLFLIFVTPFDALFFTIYSYPGNLITLVPILILYVRTPASQWGLALLGTPIQRLIALFMTLLFISHLVAMETFGAQIFLSYARKVTYVFTVMVFVWYWRDSRWVAFSIRLTVLSMTGYVALGLIDFYLGIQILPLSTQSLEGGAIDAEYEAWLGNQFRFRPPGISQNRYAAYQIVYILLGVGWLVHDRLILSRTVAGGCVFVLVMGLLASVSRSGLLGLVVASIIIAPMAFRIGVREVAVGLAVVTILGGGVYLAASSTGFMFAGLEERLSPDHVASSTSGRMLRWSTAIRVWASSPIWGVGDDRNKIESAKYLAHVVGGKGSHNAYVKVLAESGLIGMIPYLMILFVVTRTFLTSVKQISPEHEFWRPYFFGGFIGMSVSNIFNDYVFERIYMMTWSYAAVLQWVRIRHGREQRAKELEKRKSGFGQLGPAVVSAPQRPPAPSPAPGRG